jgi:hypothetical protein
MPSLSVNLSVPEPSVAVGEDPRSYARLMSAVYDATMTGHRAPARPRSVIGDSWQRMLAKGVDQDGWVAAVDSLPLHNRILLPEQIAPGRAWIPPLGMCEVELLPGGWLVRLADDDLTPAITRVTLDLSRPGEPQLEMVGQFGCWRHSISLRHAEILLVLAMFPDGRSAPELAADLYGDRSRVVTVRAEMSRLRKQLVGLVLGCPYRFPESATVRVCYPEDMTTLLAASTAPAVRAARVVR